MKSCFLNIKRMMTASAAVVMILVLPFTVCAEPAFKIDGVDELKEERQESTTVVVQNGSVPEYVPHENSTESTTEENNEAIQGEYTYIDQDVIENENGKFYTLEKGRTAYDSVSKEFVMYCGLEMVRSNYPPDIPLSKGSELHLNIPTGVTADLYKDGEKLDAQQQYIIYEPGRYVLQLENVNGKKETYNYTILGEEINYLKEIYLPEGFKLNYVEHDGSRITLQYNNHYQLLVDGSYRIGWICEPVNTYYHTEFVLDTQAPVLSLPQVVNGKAEEPVSIADLEPGAAIWYKVDGFAHSTDDPQELLDEPGKYELTVYDAAGNRTTYTFEIHIYVDVYGYIAVGMIISLVAGLMFYSKWLKKHMRVG